MYIRYGLCEIHKAEQPIFFIQHLPVQQALTSPQFSHLIKEDKITLIMSSDAVVLFSHMNDLINSTLI